MDILKNKAPNDEHDRVGDFFAKKEPLPEKKEPPESYHLRRFGNKVLLRWKALEFEKFEGGDQWQKYMWLVLIAIIGYAVYANSLVMAMAFILIGVTVYLQLGKEPRVIDFAITTDGVVAGKEIFEFDDMKSFWIFYDPPHEKYLSLHTSGHLLPFVHIAIGDQNPVEMRHILLDYVPEVKQVPGFVDMLERFLRI